MERTRRTRLATAGILLLVFVSGLLVGLALERTLFAETVTADERDPDRRDRRRGLIVERVDLEPPQRESVDSIIRDFRDRYRSIQGEMRERYEPRTRALVDSTRSAIMEVLTPEQAARYDSLLAEADREREARERRRRGRDEHSEERR